MATRKTAAPKTDKLNLSKPGMAEIRAAVAGRKPPKAAKLQRKDALGVLADKTIAAKKGAMSQEELAKRPRKMADVRASRAAKKPRAIGVTPLGATKIPTETRSAAAKRADPAPAVKLPFAQHEVKNIGQLARILDTTYGANCTWQSEFHFGANYINVLNIRGRKVAEIKLVPKK